MKPVLQALVLADHVYEDKKSGKKVIAGTFNQILFSSEPPHRELDQPDGTKKKVLFGGMQAGSPSLYMSLTDVVDGTRLHIRFANMAKNEVLFGAEFVLKCDDRLKTLEVALPLPSLSVREEGYYALEVLCEGEILGSHRIKAEKLKIS